MHNSGASRRENAKARHESVIARSEATKQSILPLQREMDCFASLAMTLCDRAVFGCLKIESGMRRSLFHGLNPFGRTSPQRVAMLGAEKTKMADLGYSGVGGSDGQDFRFD